jgi:outer membrane protein TolC
MLQERRRLAALVAGQETILRDLVAAAAARYASGSAPQADVLRAEVEAARLAAIGAALDGDLRAAEAMLNASLGRAADAPVPPLADLTVAQAPPAVRAMGEAVAARPELAGGRAAIAQAEAEVAAMHAMARPMATIRTGPAYTMGDGRGWMAMVGLTVPIWRGKLRAVVAEAEAMRAMSTADLRAMTRMIEGDAAAAAARLQAAQARHRVLAGDVLPRARLAIEPAVAGYTSGRVPLVAVVEAIQALWAIQGELIAAEGELGLAWARLGRAVGSYEAVPR